MPLITPAPCTHPAIPITIAGAARPQDARLILKRPYATYEISVGPDGHVTAAVLKESTGVAALDDAAAQAVRQWAFMPAAQGCKAVADTVIYAVPIGAPAQTFADPCNHDATVGMQQIPEFPDSARVVGHTPFTASETVSIDGAGRVTGIRLASSSGNAGADAATRRAALASTYYPAVYGCEPTPGSYTFRVTFDPNS